MRGRQSSLADACGPTQGVSGSDGGSGLQVNPALANTVNSEPLAVPRLLDLVRGQSTMSGHDACSTKCAVIMTGKELWRLQTVPMLGKCQSVDL